MHFVEHIIGRRLKTGFYLFNGGREEVSEAKDEFFLDEWRRIGYVDSKRAKATIEFSNGIIKKIFNIDTLSVSELKLVIDRTREGLDIGGIYRSSLSMLNQNGIEHYSSLSKELAYFMNERKRVLFFDKRNQMLKGY